ncbi:MAG: adenylosuccinate synthetase [Burkholderiales bacterium]|nr:adenylosuccinate synthetase [Burkholderiales bacterium]
MLCTGYEWMAGRWTFPPWGADEIERCKPIYEVMSGWSDTTVGITQYDQLPIGCTPVPAAH